MGCGTSSHSVKVSAQKETQPISIDQKKSFSTVQQSTRESYFEEILSDIQIISKPEEVNPIVCLGEDSFPLVVARLYLNDQNPTNIYLPIVSAATYKSGRIICFGSISYLLKNNLKSGDTGHLIYNCLRWAVNRARSAKPALLLSIPDPYQSDIRQYLEKHGIQTEVGDENTNYDNYRLIIVSSSFANGSVFIPFVSEGGALACFFNSASFISSNSSTSSLSASHSGNGNDNNNNTNNNNNNNISNNNNNNNNILEEETAFSMNNVLTKFGIGYTFCTLNICESNCQRIPINKNFNEVKNINFFNAIQNCQDEISKEDVSEALLDDLVTTIRFYLLISDGNTSFNGADLLPIAKATWEYLKKTGYNSPEGLCPKITHSICIILLSQLVNKLPLESLSAVPESVIFPGKSGDDIELKIFNKKLNISSYAWFSTGLWLPAGKVATVRPAVAMEHVHIQIGAHHESLLSKQGPWKRWPNLTMSFAANSKEVKVASLFGGLVYIVIERLSSSAPEVLEIGFDGFAECPRIVYDDRNVYETTKDIDVPWGEIDIKTIIFTVPSKYLSKVGDIEKFSQKFNTMIQKIIEFTAYSLVRPYRVVFDIALPEDRPGCGYPLVFSIDDIDNILFSDSPTPQLMTLLTLLTTVSIRENCFDSATELALTQISASSAILEVWSDFDPTMTMKSAAMTSTANLEGTVKAGVNSSCCVGGNGNEEEGNARMFDALWNIHRNCDPTVLSKTLELFQNPNFMVLDTPEDMWVVFVREMCRIGRKNFIPFLQKVRPIPLNISISLQGLPEFVL